MACRQRLRRSDLDGIGKSAARFDFAKLENLNGHYIRQMADADLLQAFLDFLPHVESGPELLARIDVAKKAQLLAAMPGLKDRAKTLVELKASAAYLFTARPLALDDKAKALLNDEGKAALRAIHPLLGAVNDWQVAALENAVKAHAETTGVKLGKFAQPLRAALTGTSTSPGIFDVLVVLGRDEALGRIADQMG